MVGVIGSAKWVFQSLLTGSLQQLWAGDKVCGASPRPLQLNLSNRTERVKIFQGVKNPFWIPPLVEMQFSWWKFNKNWLMTSVQPTMDYPSLTQENHFAGRFHLSPFSSCPCSSVSVQQTLHSSSPGWGIRTCQTPPFCQDDVVASPLWSLSQGCPSPLTDHTTLTTVSHSLFLSVIRGQSPFRAAPVSAPLPAAPYQQVL